MQFESEEDLLEFFDKKYRYFMADYKLRKSNKKKDINKLANLEDAQWEPRGENFDKDRSFE
jgi:hypothetical protein